MSWQAHFYSALLRHTFKRKLAAAADPLAARAVLNSGLPFRQPAGITITQQPAGGVAGEWIEAEEGGRGMTLLYLHGGGYFACSARSHRAVTTFFAQQGFRVFAPDYRLAPEHPFPAAIEDAEAVYRALLAAGVAPRRLAVAGDSAGGGLALALLLRLRARGLQMPAAAALFSPLTDLTGSGGSITANDRRCAMFHGHRIAESAQFYLAGADPRDPLASPLHADLQELPPLLIHVGSDEVLRDDSTRLADRARQAGVRVDLRLWPVVPHVWQLFHRTIPEGRQSLSEAAGFLQREIAFAGDVPPAGTAAPDVEVAIVGSGFSGLGMAMRLKQAGENSFVLLEKAHEVGGTWRENTYPGCACDVPSHMYSFSWERKPDWSRMYASQPEIQEYLRHCASAYRIYPHIRFGSAMQEARFDEARACWEIRSSDGSLFTARVLMTAMGALSRPLIPQLPGIERFRGIAFHSAEWRHDIALEGKRVAVVGTGASAIQFVPHIARQAVRLTLFQRTPAWVLPKLDGPLGPGLQRLFHRHPAAMGLFRQLIYWRQELLGLGFIHPKLMERAKKIGLSHLRRQVPDPVLRAKLTPDYTIGCKRILISNDYYPALSLPSVNLVTQGIAQVREHGIVDQDGTEHPADVIIYGTGFRVTELPEPVRILGRRGVDLNDAWRRAGPEAYLGMMHAGHPNLFMLLGPNTGLGHNSVVFMAEQQIRYAMACLRHMRRHGLDTIEVRADAQQDFNHQLQRRLQTTVWGTGCRSWYLHESGKNVTLWPGFTFEYWKAMRSVRLRHMEFGQTPAPLA